MIVFDKVSWHYPDGHNCPNIEVAKRHFEVICDWLKDNNLLSDEGLEVISLGIDSEFSLNERLLNKKGISVLESCYAAWIKSIHYHEMPSTQLLNECLDKLDA